MRILSPICAKRSRTPQNESKVVFQEILPLRLKNRVSGKADSNSDVACLYEMSLLFACLKENEFMEKYCDKEIRQFKDCYKCYMDKKFADKSIFNQGIIAPGNKLNYRQLNKYMQRYPNPK